MVFSFQNSYTYSGDREPLQLSQYREYATGSMTGVQSLRRAVMGFVSFLHSIYTSSGAQLISYSVVRELLFRRLRMSGAIPPLLQPSSSLCGV